MNTILPAIFLMDSEDIYRVITVLTIITIIAGYIIPLYFIIADIRRRYEQKVQQRLLILFAIFFLPIFVLNYMLFRKNLTSDEIKGIEDEIKIQMTSSRVKSCPKCANICAIESNYCNDCGLNLSRACIQCKEYVDLNWKFCINCGYHLKPVNVPQLSQKRKSTTLINILGYKMQYLANQ